MLTNKGIPVVLDETLAAVAGQSNLVHHCAVSGLSTCQSEGSV